jgi:hypothetical protein
MKWPLATSIFWQILGMYMYMYESVFTIRPAFPTSVKKVNTSFKNVWRTWGPALPALLADLMIFCPLGPMNFVTGEL